jgi:endogenous inhibitor of DNA gyrase (YacG/DUF329 family)
MQAVERDEHEISCPRCGADAQWSFARIDKQEVEVVCSDCGRFVMSREEFDAAAAETAPLSDLEGQ